MAMTDLDTSTILPHWTRLAEESLEAGQVPLVVLGSGPMTLDVLPGLLTLAALDETVTGLARPAALVGGDAGLWLLALLNRRRRAHSHAGGEVARRIQTIQHRVPPALFIGPDQATHLAGLNLAAQSLLPSPTASPPQDGEAPTPPGLAWALFPAHHAGAMNRWDWLPFESMANETSTPETDSAKSTPPDTQPSQPLAAWTAYLGLLMALGLVLAALLL